MWPAWHYLTGIHATGKFDNRVRAAREAPIDRKVGKPFVFFKRISASRAAAARMWPAWYYLIGIHAKRSS